MFPCDVSKSQGIPVRYSDGKQPMNIVGGRQKQTFCWLQSKQANPISDISLKLKVLISF